MGQCEFDSILFPVNQITWYQGHVGLAVLAKAQETGLQWSIAGKGQWMLTRADWANDPTQQ